MLKKWKVYFISLFFTAMFLTGCQERNTENIKNKKDGYTEKVQAEMKAQERKIADNLYLNCSIPEVSENATEYDISLKKYDFQTLCQDILGNTEEYEISVDENIGIYTAEKENGGQLLVRNGSIDYYKDMNSNLIGNLIIDQIMDSQDTVVSSLASLEEIKNRDDVKHIEKEINSYMKPDKGQLIICDAGSYSAKQLQEIENELVKIVGNAQDVVESWDGEVYTALRFQIVLNEIPVFGRSEPEQGMYGEFNVNFQSYADIILCDGKLITLSIQNMYDIIAENEVKIISAENALNKIKQKYTDIITSEKQTIEQIWLEYVAIPQWDSKSSEGQFWKLYWCFLKRDEEGCLWAERINAVTGGDLSYGE